MKHLKREIFKKLALSYITIIIIPVIAIVVLKTTNIISVQKDKLISNNYNSITQIISQLETSYSKVEKIKFLIRDDIEFLSFLTSEKEKNPMEYIEFQKMHIRNYEKFISIPSEIETFKIYVDNKNLLEIRPLILNYIPDNLTLDDKTLFIKEGDKTYIYYFREIYFQPKSVYIEVKLDLENIIGKTEENYFLYRNQNYFNVNKFFNIDNKYITEILTQNNQKIEKKKFDILEDKNVFIFYGYSPVFDFHFFNIVKKDDLIVKKYRYGAYFLFLALLSLVIIYFISYFISIRLFKQFEYIIAAVKEIKKGNFDVQIPLKDDTEEFYALSVQLNSMTTRIKTLIKESVDKEIQVKDFEIKALQSQINSHFLQNTLESIKMSAYINKDYIVSDALTNLGQILRYGMNWKNPIVPFEEEMIYVKRYIELFSFRIEHEITFRYYADNENLNRKIPKMIIQPFIENAILHGIIPKENKGLIQIRVFTKKLYTNKKTFFIEILDNGIGFSENHKTSGTGIGLTNVKDRLDIYFKTKVDIEIKSIENKFTRIIIKIEER